MLKLSKLPGGFNILFNVLGNYCNCNKLDIIKLNQVLSLDSQGRTKDFRRGRGVKKSPEIFPLHPQPPPLKCLFMGLDPLSPPCVRP